MRKQANKWTSKQIDNQTNRQPIECDTNDQMHSTAFKQSANKSVNKNEQQLNATKLDNSKFDNKRNARLTTTSS